MNLEKDSEGERHEKKSINQPTFQQKKTNQKQVFVDNSSEAIEAKRLQEIADNSPETLEGLQYQESIQEVIDESQENIKTASKIQEILESSNEATVSDLKNAMIKSPTVSHKDKQNTNEEYSWCINSNTGEYEWIACDDKQAYHIDVGAYKVVYDEECKTVYAYYQNNPEPVEELYMAMVTTKDKNGKLYKHYNDDRAAKFSMICAELGGSILKTDNPFNEALIISASLDNRLIVEGLNLKFKQKEKFSSEKLRERHGDNTYQSLFKEKQYNAVRYPSYQDFEYGMDKRTSDKVAQKVGMATVYNAMDNPVYKLQALGLKEASEILGYAHEGNPSLYKNKEIDFSSLETHNMSRIVGSEYYGQGLEEYHKKNNSKIDYEGTMDNYQYPTY